MAAQIDKKNIVIAVESLGLQNIRYFHRHRVLTDEMIEVYEFDMASRKVNVLDPVWGMITIFPYVSTDEKITEDVTRSKF